jgi:hypothetical protein
MKGERLQLWVFRVCGHCMTLSYDWKPPLPTIWGLLICYLYPVEWPPPWISCSVVLLNSKFLLTCLTCRCICIRVVKICHARPMYVKSSLSPFIYNPVTSVGFNLVTSSLPLQFSSHVANWHETYVLAYTKPSYMYCPHMWFAIFSISYRSNENRRTSDVFFPGLDICSL